MSLLSYTDLVTEIDRGLVSYPDGLLPFPVEQINGASVDLTLGDTLLFEEGSGIVDLAAKGSIGMRKVEPTDGYWDLYPGDFVLASTREYFKLPDTIAGHYMLKSSLARSAVDHLMAGFADPTWHGVLTLELCNHSARHVMRLRPGMKIGQMLFFRLTSPVPYHASYAARGQYQGDATVTASKGVR